MAYDHVGLPSFTMEAGQDLSTHQYKFVKIATDGQVDPAGAGLDIDGVVQNDPSVAGQAATIQRYGITKVIAGDTLTVGMRVKSDSVGRAIDAGSGDSIGKVLVAAAVGERATVLLEASPLAGEDEIFTATGTILTADVATLNATPVEVVAAPGAGLYIEPVSCHWFLDFATSDYDAAAAGDTLNLKYTDASGAAVIDPVAGDVIGGADADYHTVQLPPLELIPVANAAIVAHIAVGEWGTGDSPLKYEFKYRVRTLAFA